MSQRRANLEAERQQGYVVSDELSQRRANLEAERNRGLTLDTNGDYTVTYRDEVTGEEDTRTFNLNSLRSELEEAQRNNLGDELVATYHNAINAIENTQREQWEREMRKEENLIAAQESIDRQGWQARIATEESALAAQEQIEQQAWQDRVANEESRLIAQEQMEQQAWQDRINATESSLDAQEHSEQQAWQDRMQREEQVIQTAEQEYERNRQEEEARRIADENAYAAAIQQAQAQQQEEMIELENLLAAGKKAQMAQWINENQTDAVLQAHMAEVNELEKKLHMNQSNTAEDLKSNKDYIEADMARRYSEETRRAEKTKKASAPKGSGK